MQIALTLFSVVFILWVLLGTGAPNEKDDKKKESKGGGGMLAGMLLAPLLLIGWLFYALGQMFIVLLQALAALWEGMMPFFRRLFELLGRMLKGAWKTLGELLRAAWHLSRDLLRAARGAFSMAGTMLRGFGGILKTAGKILSFLRKALARAWDVLRRVFDILWLPFTGMIGFLKIAAGGRQERESEREDNDGPDTADLLLALPMAVVGGKTKRKKSRSKRHAADASAATAFSPFGRARRATALAAHGPLRTGITHRKKRGNDPHVMARLQAIGWETRRKMGKA